MAKTTLPALDGHDGSVGLDDAELEGVGKTITDPVVDVNLPLALRHTSGLGVVDRVDTSGQVELTGSLLASGDCACQPLGKWSRQAERLRTYHR